MKEFTIKITQREDGAIHALLQSDGYQSALLSEKLIVGQVNTLSHVRNLFHNLSQAFMERCLPEVAPKYKLETLPDGTTRALVL